MNRKTIFLAVPILMLLCALVALLPPIRERIAWRLELLKNRVEYAFFAPTEELFVPQGQVALLADPTILPATATGVTPTATVALTPAPLAATATPAATQTPLPASVLLQGVRYEDQHGLWNYCAPATLSMALSYWGWEGTRLDTGKYLKPFDEDLNVMPYEMASFVADRTGFGSVVRSGGNLTLLQQLVAAGFPVVIEKGTLIKETTTGQITWMGHYNLVVGYDEATQEVIVRDSYYSPPAYPLDFRITYDKLMEEWQGFNYIFLVIYPVERQQELIDLLGDLADEATSNLLAAEKASNEVYSLTGVQKFFAWYNRGSSLVTLQDYTGAAAAYDEAFTYLASLPEDEVPKKIMRVIWYQTGPYFAYFYTGRYQDVLTLSDQTMTLPNKGPYLEESFYWRAKAKISLGDNQGAIEDLRKSLEYHPGFVPSVELMQQLGIPE